MVNLSKYILVSLLMLFLTANIVAQTADVVTGCIPLEVNFTAPNQSNYFWEFGDLATSNLQNPEHIFTSSGDFTVKLYDGVGGALIGEIQIKVYPDPIIEILADPLIGCSPLEVNFTPNITIDPDITILSYLWTFGEGTSSTLENPTHLYQNAGTYTVSLKIETSLTECNKTIIVDDLVVVQGVSSSFVLNKIADCDIPATFNITNLTENSPDLDYIWEFDDGDGFMGFDPGSVTYNEAGVYNITLTVINEQGCESKIVRTVTVGPPPFDMLPADQCIGNVFTFFNITTATSYMWNFGSGAVPSTSSDKNPELFYSTGGQKTITLSITNSANCSNDTTFTINVQDPSALFTISPPMPNCITPVLLTIAAVDPTFTTYDWNITNDNVDNFQINHDWPERDSLHLHWADSLKITLDIVTDIGCTANHEEWFTQRKPDAYFTVNQTSGCAPLEVQFTDDTRSVEDVVSWHWLYGTGDEQTLFSEDPHSYIFENPGEYYCRLVIENDAGCIDTSAGLWILVGEQISSDFTIDETEICLGESITISIDNVDPRIDAWHVNTDDNRFNHCWTSNTASHEFVHAPGVFDVNITTEYNGCYWQETTSNAITVNGAKANLSYMTNCEDPYTVMFESKSLGETSVLWDIPEGIQYTDNTFSHTFPGRDTVEVFLTAFDATSDCPVGIDSATIYIVDLEANFILPKNVCDNVEYFLDASTSIDVHENCSKGYLWILPANRPRELEVPLVDAYFPQPGDQDVTLIVEDINGCTDTITHSTRSFGIDANFTLDQTNICLPDTVNFADISVSDTIIQSWEWSFGSSDSLTSNIFTEGVGVIEIQLTITDTIGCMETVSKSITVYEVESQITFDNGPGICIGEDITFNAADFTSQGSFLNFEWDFGPFGTSTNQSENIVFDQNGNFDINIVYTEEQSGCMGMETIPITVVNEPIADFSTEFDNDEEICHPAILEFMNNSTTDGFVTHRWNFGNGITSNEENPFNSFAKGTYDVELIVSSIYGCKDTLSKTYTLVGPEGGLTLDKNVICKGDEITFTMTNPIDVNSFTWVFGDGQTEENINPITHQFDFNPPGGETKVDLILKSVENGCEFILTEPISIIEILADFEVIDSSYCEGLAFFENKSIGDIDNFTWDFGNGSSSTQNNPTIIYDDLGNYDVTLRVSDAAGVCKDELTKSINIEAVEDFIFFPNVFTPNSDAVNDFFNVVVSPGYEDVVKIITFQVYNRWGNKLYDNDAPALGWDGNVNTTPSPAEVYAYYIEVEVIDCNNKSKKGNVTIVR